MAAVGWGGLTMMKEKNGQANSRSESVKSEKPTPSRFARLRSLIDPSRSGAFVFILLTAGIYVAVRLTAPSRLEHAQLRFVENGGSENPDADTGSPISHREPLSGTAYETALRLREAGAVGMAVSLAVFARHGATGKANVSYVELISEMMARKLFPPGIEIEDGSFRSSLSELRFSYRAAPLSFEILTLPKAPSVGPAILLKFPLPVSEANSVIYFEASSTAQTPVPFSSNEQLSAAGWKIRRWRGDALPLNETAMRELREQSDVLRATGQRR